MKHSFYQSPLSNPVDLKKRWEHSLAISKIDPVDAQEVFMTLMKRYEAPGRYYHNSEHLEELFAWAEQFRELWEDPLSIEWAIWFHDSVYEVGKPDNEAQSAIAAEAQLEQWGLTKATITRVKLLIEATATHKLWDDLSDSAHFLDMDLAILGAPEERYTRYTQDIRKEYQVFPDMLYYPGRLQVVEKFLARPAIYHSANMKGLLEQQARINLRHEQEQLSAAIKGLNI